MSSTTGRPRPAQDLPGTFGISPYAFASIAATAENFGWQGPPSTAGITPAASTGPAMPMANGLLQGSFAPASIATGGVSAGADSATAGPGSSLAVIYGGSRGDSGNPLGHIAIAVEGHGLYSFGTNPPLGSSITDYVNDQKSQRDMAVVTIPTSPARNKAVLGLLARCRFTIGCVVFSRRPAAVHAVLDACTRPRPNAVVRRSHVLRRRAFGLPEGRPATLRVPGRRDELLERTRYNIWAGDMGQSPALIDPTPTREEPMNSSERQQLFNQLTFIWMRVRGEALWGRTFLLLCQLFDFSRSAR